MGDERLTEIARNLVASEAWEGIIVPYLDREFAQAETKLRNAISEHDNHSMTVQYVTNIAIENFISKFKKSILQLAVKREKENGN